jgi:anaerobic selenocysteine-containing dehydrogenase
VASLSKLKFLVTIDPLNTETSTFWQNHGESNDVDPAKIQTEVFRLPSTCFAEENGSIVNSGRWLQWHWKGSGSMVTRNFSFDREATTLFLFGNEATGLKPWQI